MAAAVCIELCKYFGQVLTLLLFYLHEGQVALDQLDEVVFWLQVRSSDLSETIA